MRILIIAIPRSGSTNLLYNLSEKNKLKPIFEPYGRFKKSYDTTENNIIVKTIINQYENNIELVKNFDTVILLSRKNLVECAESFSFLMKNRDNGFKVNTSYFYENISKEEFENYYNMILDYHTQLLKLSDVLNIPITYYEDIYNINSEHRLRKRNKDSNKNFI